MANEHSGGWSSYVRPLVRQSRFKMFSTLGTVREWAGSNASIAAVTGSMQSLLDPSKMMSMQEDARTHKISSEVMRQSLYKNVEGPRCHGRSRMRSSRTWSDISQEGQSGWYPRYYQSLPPTPMESVRPTPSHSPTRKFSFRFLSRGTTPRCSSPNGYTIVEEDADEGSQGLASILKPRPRIIRADHSYNKGLGFSDGLSDGLTT